MQTAACFPAVMPRPDLTDLGELTVSENVTVEAMMHMGAYEGFKRHIALIGKTFSVTRRGLRRLYLAHFKQVIGTFAVEQSVAAMGRYGQALIEDVLVVGLHPRYQKLQLEFPIVGLGSSTMLCGRRCFPALYRWLGGRGLELSWCDDEGWRSLSRFLLIGT